MAELEKCPDCGRKNWHVGCSLDEDTCTKRGAEVCKLKGALAAALERAGALEADLALVQRHRENDMVTMQTIAEAKREAEKRAFQAEATVLACRNAFIRMVYGNSQGGDAAHDEIREALGNPDIDEDEVNRVLAEAG